MPRLTIRCLLIFSLILPAVFADDEPSVFEQQGGVEYSMPDSEKNYLAELAPFKHEISSYLGINAILGLSIFKPEVAVTNGSGVISSSFTNKKALNYGGGVYGGVGTNFNHFYIGTELSLGSAIPKNIKVSATVNKENISLVVKQSMVAGFDIIPGYLTPSRDILFYGRFGVGSSLYRLNFSDTTNSGGVGNNTNKIVFGLRAGLGMEFLINDWFGVRAEYVYNKYRNPSSSYNFNGVNYSYKATSSSFQQVNLGVAVHF